MLTLKQTEQVRTFTTYGRNFYVFCQEVLGFHDLIPPHQQLCEFLQHDQTKTKLILMPRYSFKSSLCTIGYALWRLVRQDDLRILIYSHSNAKAEGFLNGIKNHILGLNKGSKFRTIYGSWESDAKKGVWNQAAIIVSVRSSAHDEPSVDTAGIETGKVGAHYDLIIFDDIVSAENVTTKEQMDKVVKCYRDSRSLLKPNGEVLIVGTRWHFGDLYGRLLEEQKQGAPIASLIRAAEENGTYPFSENGTLTKEFLAEQKRIQGSYKYSVLYQNAPTDDETATFQVSDFQFYNPSKTDAFKTWVQTLYITAVLDAIPPPTSDHGDDAAITVVGTDHEHTMFLLDAVAGRMTPDQQVDELFSLHAYWRFRKVGLETNAFQRMFKTELDRRLTAARLSPHYQPFSIVEFSGVTQGNKEQRIQGLQPWHERGAIKFPGTTVEALTGVWRDLAYQMIQFPHSAKDDLLDSLAYQLQLKQAGELHPTPVDIPYSSAAWFEREEQKEALQVMARRPRWTRTPVPALSLS